MLNRKITRSLSRAPRQPGFLPLSRLLLLTLFMLPLSVTAGVYKWTDKDGNVHYGSQRPADAQAEKLKIETSKPLSQPPETKKDKPAEKAEAEKEAAPTEPAKAKQPEPPKEPVLSRKQKKQLCSQARQRLAAIESRGRLKATDEKGNVRHLTDAERSSRLKEARGDVGKYCR